ncbi:MAG: YqaJ viral recombinase family protein [Epibacterium sp.]|nr:YqaJ viral recombinase family protein [Epibacterium sp.]NQX74896.1 YqaJ viral recombinase family protein [Epibacterium sp.]
MNEQGTPEWHAERCGKVTASRIADVMAKTKSGPGAARKNYMAELLTERLTGQPRESFTSSAMQWGTDTEPQARAMYALEYNVDVVEVGFVPHPDLAKAGASPDGLVYDDGLVEIKCPNTATHIETLRTEKIDRRYILQMNWQMICTGREWCDFVSFDPRLPDAMQMFVKTVLLDGDLSVEINQSVADFLAELDAMESEMRQKFNLEEF